MPPTFKKKKNYVPKELHLVHKNIKLHLVHKRLKLHLVHKRLKLHLVHKRLKMHFFHKRLKLPELQNSDSLVATNKDVIVCDVIYKGPQLDLTGYYCWRKKSLL